MKTFILTLLAVLAVSFGSANAAKYKESTETTRYCTSIGGKEEVRHYYMGKRYIKVDCETATEVIEAGLDKRSSLDSIQQAVFFSVLTGKKPVVVVYDTDGKEGIYEYRIRKACEYLGIEYRLVRVK